MKKNYFFTLLLVVVAACSTGQKVTKGENTLMTSGDYYDDAMKAADDFEKSNFLDEKSYTQALSSLEEVLSIEKLNADAWFNFGRILFYKGEYSRAKEALKNAIRYRRNFVEAYALLTKLSLAEGNMDYAFAVAEKANEVMPDNNILLNNLAVVYIKGGDLEKGLEIVDGIIKKDSKFTPAYRTAGEIYYLQGKYELSRLIYLKAIDQGNDSGELYTDLGLVALKTDDKAIAFGYLKNGVEKSPSSAYAHLNFGLFCLESGDYDTAITELKTALRFNPRLVEALVGLGTAYTKVKLFNEAENLYKKAIYYDHNFAEAYFNYGILLMDYKKDPAKALSMFKEFIAIKGNGIKEDHRVYQYIADVRQKKQKAVKK